MLNRIPAPVHRAALRVAHELRKHWWRIRKPRVFGCRVLAIDAQGGVLLVRHSYGSGKWMPPGGAVGRREGALAAALRELREETACVLCEAREVAVSTENLFGAGNQVHVVAGRAEGTAKADGREIVEVRFFALDALPEGLSSDIAEEIAGWIALYESHSSES